MRSLHRLWLRRLLWALCPQGCCQPFLFLEAVLERKYLVRDLECRSGHSFPLERGQPPSLLWGVCPGVLRCLLRSWGPVQNSAADGRGWQALLGSRAGRCLQYNLLQLRKVCQELGGSLQEVRVRGAFSCPGLIWG